MRGAIPPLSQYVFMGFSLVTYRIRLHGVLLSYVQEQLGLFTRWIYSWGIKSHLLVELRDRRRRRRRR
jgi:hypothetical protein